MVRVVNDNAWPDCHGELMRHCTKGIIRKALKGDAHTPGCFEPSRTCRRLPAKGNVWFALTWPPTAAAAHNLSWQDG